MNYLWTTEFWSALGSILSAIAATMAWRAAQTSYKSTNEGSLYQMLFQTKRDLDLSFSEYQKNPEENNRFLINTCTENYLNILELFCNFYLQNRIDRPSFRDLNEKTIKDLVKNPIFRDRFTLDTDYKNIKKVYDIWTCLK